MEENSLALFDVLTSSWYNRGMKRAIALSKSQLLLILGCTLFVILTIWGASYVLNRALTPNPKPVAAEQTPVVVPEIPPIVEKEPPTVAELLRLTNEERAEVGAKALTLHDKLNRSAQLKAEEMERTGVFEHVSPSGKQGWTYIDDVGMTCRDTAENLSGNETPQIGTPFSAEDVLTSWMTSVKGHKESVLSPRWELVGYGVSANYVVQHLCDLS